LRVRQTNKHALIVCLHLSQCDPIQPSRHRWSTSGLTTFIGFPTA
jgi:hypothetical protein